MNQKPEETLADTIADTAHARFDFGAFNDSMAGQHRTHQQNFTRLCVEWLMYCAKDSYQTDARNADTKELAQEFARNCTKGLRYI